MATFLPLTRARSFTQPTPPRYLALSHTCTQNPHAHLLRCRYSHSRRQTRLPPSAPVPSIPSNVARPLDPMHLCSLSPASCHLQPRALVPSDAHTASTRCPPACLIDPTCARRLNCQRSHAWAHASLLHRPLEIRSLRSRARSSLGSRPRNTAPSTSSNVEG